MEVAREIVSILDSQLPSEEKRMLLATLLAQEIIKRSSSTEVDVQDKIQHKEEANTNELKDDDAISKPKDESLSRSSSQQAKAKGSLDDPFIIEALSSILKSDLKDKSSSVLAAILFGEDISLSKDNTVTTLREVKLPLNSDKIQHKEEANTKELKDDDVISKAKDEPLSCSSFQQYVMETVEKRSLGPFITEGVSSILKPDLSLEDLPLVLAAIVLGKNGSLSKDNMVTTSQEIELPVNSKKSQDSEEKAKSGDKNLLHDETSENIDESLSFHSPQQEGKANVASGSELNLKEKSIDNGTEKDIPPSEDDTSSTTDDDASSTSSKVVLEKVDQLTDTNARIRVDQLADTKASSPVIPAEERSRIMSIPAEEKSWIMPEHEVLTIKESHINSGGNEDELTIHTQEAACKHCHKLMLHETHVLKAKCGCTETLIHEDCANVWSQEKGNKCSYCEKEIQNTTVTISLVPRQANGENHRTPSFTSRGSWCCFM